MKTSLVALDYQGLAEMFGTRPVIYAVKFQDGLCKIGKTKNLKKRLKGLRNHGLCSPISSVVAVPAKNIDAAEKLALKVAASFADSMRGPEVFFGINFSIVRAVLRFSAKATKLIKQRRKIRMTEKEMTDLASGCFGVDLSPSTDRFVPDDLSDAVDFVLAMQDIEQERFELAINGLRWGVLRLIPIINQVIIKLATSGVGYPDRKKILESAALELRVVPFPALTHQAA